MNRNTLKELFYRLDTCLHEVFIHDRQLPRHTTSSDIDFMRLIPCVTIEDVRYNGAVVLQKIDPERFERLRQEYLEEQRNEELTYTARHTEWLKKRDALKEEVEKARQKLITYLVEETP